MRFRTSASSRLAAGLALVAALSSVQCATNPATGETQIAMISEAREIEMGREADEQITASMGLYDDPELARYVDQIGQVADVGQAIVGSIDFFKNRVRQREFGAIDLQQQITDVEAFHRFAEGDIECIDFQTATDVGDVDGWGDSFDFDVDPG